LRNDSSSDEIFRPDNGPSNLPDGSRSSSVSLSKPANPDDTRTAEDPDKSIPPLTHYEGANYKGDSQRFLPGSYNIRGLGAVRIDKANSIKVADGYPVELYERLGK
jgi:hypothetical protein